jgi:hypothetical protein
MNVGVVQRWVDGSPIRTAIKSVIPKHVQLRVARVVEALRCQARGYIPATQGTVVR